MWPDPNTTHLFGQRFAFSTQLINRLRWSCVGACFYYYYYSNRQTACKTKAHLTKIFILQLAAKPNPGFGFTIPTPITNRLSLGWAKVCYLQRWTQSDMAKQNCQLDSRKPMAVNNTFQAFLLFSLHLESRRNRDSTDYYHLGHLHHHLYLINHQIQLIRQHGASNDSPLIWNNKK